MENISSTNSVILFCIMQTVPPEFVHWLEDRLNEKNWGIREAARHIGVSHPTISDILTVGKTPSFDTCIAIARTFKAHPVYVLKLAGLLPKDSTDLEDKETGEMLMLFSQLSEDQQEQLIAMAKFFVDRRAQVRPARADG